MDVNDNARIQDERTVLEPIADKPQSANGHRKPQSANGHRKQAPQSGTASGRLLLQTHPLLPGQHPGSSGGQNS
jgi:hypothetical protein